jgi:hypothetical protein
VFDLTLSQSAGKTVFGVKYADVVATHDNAVLPPLLQRIVDLCIERGSSPANRGLFCGVSSFNEVCELRNALIFDLDIDISRFDPGQY